MVFNKSLLISIITLICSINAIGATYTNSLDPNHKITIETAPGMAAVTFNGQRYKLDGNTIYLDSELTDQQAAASKFIYNNVREALEAINVGPESTTTKTILVAPGVYWIDDPDDNTDKEIGMAGLALGKFIDCPKVAIIGLAVKPEYIVFASNRSEGFGAAGEYSMLFLICEEVNISNITFGNYCNTDLVYTLKKTYDHDKRTNEEVPIQVIQNSAYKVVAENCRFVNCRMTGVKE